MEFFTTKREGVVIVILDKDSLDAKDAPEFKQKVLDMIVKEDAKQVVFDLSRLKFIDSSGLGSFLGISRSLHHRGGGLKLACMSSAVRGMFELVSMHKIFEIFASVDEAVKSFTQPSERV